jgi:hypothetical protein
MHRRNACLATVINAQTVDAEEVTALQRLRHSEVMEAIAAQR